MKLAVSNPAHIPPQTDTELVLFQLPRCVEAERKYCVEQFDAMNCKAAVEFCDNELSTGYRASGELALNFCSIY